MGNQNRDEHGRFASGSGVKAADAAPTGHHREMDQNTATAGAHTQVGPSQTPSWKEAFQRAQQISARSGQTVLGPNPANDMQKKPPAPSVSVRQRAA